LGEDIELRRGLGTPSQGSEEAGDRGLLVPERMYDSTTFLTEDQRLDLDQSLLSYGILPGTFTGGDMEEYWRHHSALSANFPSTFRQRQGGKPLNVRNPKYKVSVPEGKKRFVARVRERRERLDGETGDEGDEFGDEAEADERREGEDEGPRDEVRQPNAMDEGDADLFPSEGRARKTVIAESNAAGTGTAFKPRNAFIRTARVVCRPFFDETPAGPEYGEQQS
jgi:hypothetical protein